MALIERYGEHWERTKMFGVSADGGVEWTESAWPEADAALDGARGIYLLYRGTKPIYIGSALQGENPLGERLRQHAQDELAPWWDSACWYHFDPRAVSDEAVRAIESLMIAHTSGIWNGAQPQKPFGTECFIGYGGHATNELWKNAPPDATA